MPARALTPAILFVCLGNICRSPLAEAALRARLAEAGREWLVDSAGTGNWHVGHAPDIRAQAVARRHGQDISGYRARQLEPGDFYRFTHIFALDRDNLAAIRARAPADATASTGLLLDLVPGQESQSVVDPYFGTDEGFEVTWQQVDAAAQAYIANLRADHCRARLIDRSGKCGSRRKTGSQRAPWPKTITVWSRIARIPPMPMAMVRG